MLNDDNDLRECFAELRRYDQAHAGEFDALLRRRRPTAPLRRFSTWIAVAACLAVAIGVALAPRRMSHPHPTPEISITEWKSSTDFLLRTPGQEVLQTIPKLGAWPTEVPWRSNSAAPAAKKNLTQTFLEEKLS